MFIETPAEANSKAPAQMLTLSKYENSRKYCNEEMAFTTSLQLVEGRSAEVRLIQFSPNK